MKPKIKKIQYKKNYIYHIYFDDGNEGDIDFKDFLWGEAFEQLHDRFYFQKAFIDETSGTITWSNGVDISPETLHQKIV
jgi:hypothetical protein